MSSLLLTTASAAPFPAYGAFPTDIDGFGILYEEVDKLSIGNMRTNVEIARAEDDPARPDVNTAPLNPGYWQYTRTTFASPEQLDLFAH
jgi:hypothetical protein